LGEIKYWHDFNSKIASVNDSRRNTVDVPDGMSIFYQILPNTKYGGKNKVCANFSTIYIIMPSLLLCKTI
jgi:hypothetical protein